MIRYRELFPEERVISEEVLAQRSETRRNRSNEEKQKTRDKIQQTWSLKSEEERREAGEHISLAWGRKTKEERSEIARKRYDAFIGSKTTEEIQAFYEKIQESHRNRTDEERAESRKKQAESNRRRWADWTAEKRAEVLEKNSEGNKAYQASLSPERKEELRKKNSESVREAFRNKSDEEKAEWFSKIGKVLNIHPNYQETKLLELLQPFGFEFVGDGKFWIADDLGSMNPDFLRKDDNFIVELYGERYHTEEEWRHRKQRLESLGFKAVMVWANDLKLEQAVVLEKIFGKL